MSAPSPVLAETLARLEREGKIERGWKVRAKSDDGKLTCTVTATFRRTLTFKRRCTVDALEAAKTELAADLAQFEATAWRS